MNARDVLKKALADMGADGLYTTDCDELCGCGIDDLAPCECDLLACFPAKKVGNMFYPMEGS